MFQQLEFKRVLPATAFLCLIKSQSTHFKVLTCKTIFCTDSSRQPAPEMAHSTFAAAKRPSCPVLETRHAVCKTVLQCSVSPWCRDLLFHKALVIKMVSKEIQACRQVYRADLAGM
jgi:hypothetical protein